MLPAAPLRLLLLLRLRPPSSLMLGYVSLHVCLPSCSGDACAACASAAAACALAQHISHMLLDCQRDTLY